MHRKFLSLVVAGALLAMPAMAQETSTEVEVRVDVPVRANVNVDARVDAEAGQETRRDEKEERQTEVRVRLMDARGDIVLNIAEIRVENTVRIFTATANRLDKIVNRIESRIKKIKDAGGDTAEAEAELALGVESLADARAEIQAFASIDLGSSTSSTTAKTLFGSIKTGASKAKTLLRETHTHLVDAITLLKGMSTTVEVEGEAEVNSAN